MKNKKIVGEALTSKACVATCPAGLGNRIKCMVSTIKKGGEYVYWPVNDACGCELEDLFQRLPLKHIYESELDTIKVDAYSGYAEINKSWKFESTTGNELDFKYHKLNQSDIDEFLPYFKYIIPTRYSGPAQDIQDTVWAFMNKYKYSFDRKEVIGVHIRKGDYNVSFDGRQHISTEDRFIERMICLLEVNPNYKFLLCTEDEETENKFKEIFNEVSNNANADTIICFPKRFRGRNSSNAIKEAFVDILLLSKCTIIIGTFLSTFTEIAWWIGGCQAQVIIPGEEDKEAVDKVWAQLPKKGEGIYKKILRKIKIWMKE